MAEVRWGHLKSHELRELAEKNAIVIVPVASIEQHGPHLPVQVDMKLCGEVARRAALRLSEQQPVVVTPPVWSGLAEHHMAFGGTITLDLETFSRLICGIVRSLVRLGHGRIILLNGHGGNSAALRVIVAELTIELEIPLATADYWSLAAEAYREILERQVSVRHAGEAETSMMMALAGDLVAGDRLNEAHGPQDLAAADGSDANVYKWRSFETRSETGVIGDARLATPEKGELLLNVAAAALAERLMREETWAPPF